MDRHKPASGVLISQGRANNRLRHRLHGRADRVADRSRRTRVFGSSVDRSGCMVSRILLLMPDHLHFFRAPRKLEISLEVWIKYWKRLFTIKARNPKWRWQAHKWDTRLRRSESYREKWNYVRLKPERKGLVSNADDWTLQGTQKSSLGNFESNKKCP